MPVVGAIVREGDRRLWQRTIVESNLVDVEFYAAQRGWSSVSPKRAVRDYVARGFRRGLSLNPLVDEVIAGRDLPEPDRVPALYAYLVGDRRTVTVHPWWDALDYGRGIVTGIGPVEHAWANQTAAILRLRVGNAAASVPLRDIRRAAIEAARAWSRRENGGSASATTDASTGIVRLIQRQDRDYDRKVAVAAELADNADVVVVGVGIDASQWVSLAIARSIHPGLRAVLVHGGHTYGAVLRRTLPLVSGGTVAVVDPRAELTAAEIRRLGDAVTPGTIAAPVSLQLDGTLAGIGAARIGETAICHVLEAHPVEDLEAFGTEAIEVPILLGRTFAIARADIEIFDPAGDRDLLAISERFVERGPRHRLIALTDVVTTQYAPDVAFGTSDSFPVVAPVESRDQRRLAESLLDRAGFDVLRWDTGSARAHPVLMWRRPTPDAQRWAVKICAPPGRMGEVWGDTHFGRGIASALRRRGHFVALDAFDARSRTTNYLDDVTLVVRGPYRIDPPRTGRSVEWIISHPDQITRDELSKFGHVFAASERWSRKATQQWGISVEPLLECTDVDLFHPLDVERGDDIVFVGTARGIARPSVVAPLAAGIPVKVYGPDWRTFIPASAIAATAIPNDRLPERYATASIVLNDHWPAMRREGFMAMRPFDVVAVGGRVISEDVDGLRELFAGAVVPYADENDLIELLRRDPADIFPDDETLASIAERIRRDHSFDARARVLDGATKRTTV